MNMELKPISHRIGKCGCDATCGYCAGKPRGESVVVGYRNGDSILPTLEGLAFYQSPKCVYPKKFWGRGR